MLKAFASPLRHMHLGHDVTDHQADELRALEHVIRQCRLKAASFNMPALNHILRRAELSLSAHAETGASPRRRVRSVPSGNAMQH